MLRKSGLIDQWERDLVGEGGKQYALYGDPVYPLYPFLLSEHRGDGPTPEQAAWNTRMSSVRVSVELGYAVVINYWTAIDFKKIKMILEVPVAKMYFVAVFLANYHTCLTGDNSIVSKFGIQPPTVEEFMAFAI
eukprot:1375993-Amorphochlora_amoeboformis.AAC.1